MPYGPHDAQPQDRDPATSHRARRGAIAAVVALAIAVPAAWMVHRHEHAAAPASAPVAQLPGGHLADFEGQQPSPDVKLMANWIAATGDNGKHAFVLVDKKSPRVYVFTPDGKLQDSAPALMGAAHGDDLKPGTADLPLAKMTPEDKITPAGRFVAEPGQNADDEDVIWVDYDAAISMHRVRPKVAAERRLERLASLTTDDNRISFGCINLPVAFYEDVAHPTVQKYGAVIYVLPEVKTVQQVFGAYDVTDPAQVAAAQKAHATMMAHTPAAVSTQNQG